MEADIYPYSAPEKSDAIDGVLGDGSAFHQTHGYYAHGVGPDTAKAPAGWERRLVRVDVPPRAGLTLAAVAWCLEAHDLVLAKCAAGRERDREFARDALNAGVVDGETLRVRVVDLPVGAEQHVHIGRMLRAIIDRMG
jgi:hypothetical protein